MDKLRDKDRLLNTADNTAYMVVSSNNTKTAKPRKLYLRDLPEIKRRVSPVSLSLKRELLVSFTGDTPANRASTSQANNLDFSDGTTRFSFDDYEKIETVVETGVSTSFPYHYSSWGWKNGEITEEFSVGAFKESDSSTPILITSLLQANNPSRFANMGIWYVSATSFRITTSHGQNIRYFLKAIYGLKA